MELTPLVARTKSVVIVDGETKLEWHRGDRPH